MKLITWNCQGAFRKKAEVILSHKPDILVVQECERTDKQVYSSKVVLPKDFYWHGDNVHKGIGVYSYSDYRFTLLPDFNSAYRYVLPFNVTGRGQSFILFAIWAMNNKENRDASYIGQVWLAINYYKKLLRKETILTGDFNSNKIWDYEDKVGTHSDVVRMLADNNIHSIYHRHLGFEQGKEKHPTFFLYRKQNKSYHIDYCFASENIANKVESVKIGTYKKWIAYSDHSPLEITFNI